MAPKPSLVLEIDEHSADAGVVTRLEAFLESLDSAPARRCRCPSACRSIRRRQRQRARRTIYIPWMGDQSYALAAAFRAYGQPAEVIPLADQQSIELGRRYCSGKECLPCIITAGDMIRVTPAGRFRSRPRGVLHARRLGPLPLRPVQLPAHGCSWTTWA